MHAQHAGRVHQLDDEIGVGLPGLVDTGKGMMIDTLNLVPEFAWVPLADMLHAATGLSVFVDNDVNALAPGKRVRQTINPQLAVKDGRPFMVFGTPGADTQPQTQLQFFLNVVEFGMSVHEALEQGAAISNSFRDSYDPHIVAGKLIVPASLPKHVLDALARLGHKLDVRDSRGVGSV